MSDTALSGASAQAEQPAGRPDAPDVPDVSGATSTDPESRPARGGARDLLTRLVGAVASGAALQAAFPQTDLWWVAPAGVALLALAVRGARPRRAALVGLVAGLVYLGVHLHWTGVYVGALPWVALTFLEAAFVALTAAVMPWAWRAPGGRAGTVVAVAGLWVIQEALRGRVPFGGLPWGRLAFSQADAPTVGYAWLGGAPLLSFVVAATGGCVAVAAASAWSAWSARRVAARVSVRAAAVGVAGPLLAGAALTAGGLLAPLSTSADRSAQVSAVQGNVPEPGLEFNARRRAVLDNHARATRELARQVQAGSVPAPDVVLWPENSSDIDPLRNDDAYAVIQSAADAVGVPVLVGAVLDQPADHLSNAGMLWFPSGDTQPAGPAAMYVKRHPAPFGEYIPFRSFFRIFSDKVDLVRSDFVAGDKVAVMTAPSADGPIRIGDVICFEVAYDGLVSDPVRDGADLLVVQTNNATFGFTDESVQQLAMSRVRAVENGRSVVHISTVGVSALIEPDGRVVARSGHFTADTLNARLPLRTELTPATRLRWYPEAALAALGGVLVAVGGLRSRPSRRSWREPSAPSGSSSMTQPPAPGERRGTESTA